MVDIRGLMNLQDTRQVRELINTPQGMIEIYEPTIDDIATIIDLQREKGLGMETGSVTFDGVTVIRELFPMLTNIQLGDLTDEQLEEVIENPSVHLLIAQQVVAQIVAEANKLYAQRVKTELMNTESVIAQAELIQSIPSFILEKSKNDGKVQELVKKVETATEELEEAIRKEEEKAQQEEEVKDEQKN